MVCATQGSKLLGKKKRAQTFAEVITDRASRLCLVLVCHLIPDTPAPSVAMLCDERGICRRARLVRNEVAPRVTGDGWPPREEGKNLHRTSTSWGPEQPMRRRSNFRRVGAVQPDCAAHHFRDFGYFCRPNLISNGSDPKVLPLVFTRAGDWMRSAQAFSPRSWHPARFAPLLRTTWIGSWQSRWTVPIRARLGGSVNGACPRNVQARKANPSSPTVALSYMSAKTQHIAEMMEYHCGHGGKSW